MKPAFWGPDNNSPASIPLLAAILASQHHLSLPVLAVQLEQNLRQTFPRMMAVG
jgi:hypothetical protein